MARTRDSHLKGKRSASIPRATRPSPLKKRPPEPEKSAEARLEELSRTNRQLKRKIFDLYTIFEISRNFNAVLDYKTLLESFIFTCLGQVGALRAALFLKESADSREFRLAKAKGSGAMPPAGSGFQDDTRLIRYLSRLNRPTPVVDLSPDLTTVREREVLGFFKGGMLVPLIYKTRLAGLFLLADKIAEKAFTQDEIEFISSLGNQISVAIENARLYEGEKAANEQLWEAQSQLMQAERLATLGEMSAKIAHEVNNPLGIIKNYLLLLQRSGGEPDKQKHYVEVVSQEIDRIARIVEELRRFHRPSRVEFAVVDLREILDGTLALSSRQLSISRIDIQRKLSSEPLFVKGSADHLRQVFLNLILNARDAMKQDGRLTVELNRRGNEAHVRFADTGPGIPPEVIPRIFEPFFTTKGDDGSGLGLSICQSIIKSHKGSIIYTNADHGGCFDIHLPLVAKP
ncbi:MAG: ATP-binding protein [Candidatus Zixiibacteriota bacterium]